MKMLNGSILLLICFLTNVLRVMSTTVGLYAPDRYDGIPEMCLMPMDFGYCRAKVKRYYFDMRRMKCAMFYWGGCAGNINNFKSVEECNKVCVDGFIDSIIDEQPKGRDTAARTASTAAAKAQYSNNKTSSSARNFKYDSKVYQQPKSSDVGDSTITTNSNKNDRNIRKNDESVEYEYEE